MTDHTPFLRTIAANPADDGPRLVYADWLEERGDTARAEFIRLQCEQARLGWDRPEARALELRANGLLDVHWREWMRPVMEALGEPPATLEAGLEVSRGSVSARYSIAPAVPRRLTRLRFWRGFPDHIFLT